MKEHIQEVVAAAVRSVLGESAPPDLAVELSRPEEKFGDFATNAPLKLAGTLGRNPRELAEAIAAAVQDDAIVRAEVAGPGFINITVSDAAILRAAAKNVSETGAQQGSDASSETPGDAARPSPGEILVEFGDPNPFKEMHLGHLYTSIVGDAIAGLFEASGATVRRLSYHGDVGLHVAQAIWGILQVPDIAAAAEAGTIDAETLDASATESLGKYYSTGATAYTVDLAAADAIKEINERVYDRADRSVTAIHEWGVAKSFAYFDGIYKDLGITYTENGRYLESKTTEVGLGIVRERSGSVFEESEGAVVYKGERAGLHTRVFINSRGLPTYETKDLGLAVMKDQDYPECARSIVITANEQSEYFKVMLAALAEIHPEISTRTTHIAHGFLSLTTGKMSSRTGQVYSGRDLMDEVASGVRQAYPDSAVWHDVYLAAIKYAFLKHRIGGDIVFDVKESVSLEGNSGPYIQYAHARARSILAKHSGGAAAAANEAAADASAHAPADASADTSAAAGGPTLEAAERSLARKLSEYPEVLSAAAGELMPHLICTYLYELAQVFNRFYETSKVVGDPREDLRISLVLAYADTLRGGLSLLNIPAPDHM